jgi:hypothetical protein
MLPPMIPIALLAATVYGVRQRDSVLVCVTLPFVCAGAPRRQRLAVLFGGVCRSIN